MIVKEYCGINNYLHIKKTNYEICRVKHELQNTVYVHELHVYNKKYKYALIYPFNHKKLMTIINLTKVIKKKLKIIIKEVYNNKYLLNCLKNAYKN